jgi:hypothetical protein
MNLKMGSSKGKYGKTAIDVVPDLQTHLLFESLQALPKVERLDRWAHLSSTEVHLKPTALLGLELDLVLAQTLLSSESRLFDRSLPSDAETWQ